MTDIYLNFKIEGEKVLSRRLRTLDADMKNWGSEFQRTGLYLKRFFSGNVFESRGAVIGEPWRPLSPRYAMWKAKRYPGRGILVRTGKMKKSFQYNAGANYVRIFNTTDYFKYHQSRLPRTKLPRRIMMKLDEKRKQAIIQIFRQGLERYLRKNKLA